MSEYEHAEWCAELFRVMSQGGVWGIPRSGLVFRKEGTSLVLVSEMPWSEEMSVTKQQLHAAQLEEFEVVRENFGRAGIEVRR